MKAVRALFVAAALAAASTSIANAATVNAVAVADYSQGSGITDPLRTVTGNALGPADGSFLSLGIGGWAVFSFATPFTGPGSLVEVTFGDRFAHVERANVYAGSGPYTIGNGFTGLSLLASIVNTVGGGVASFIIPSVFNYLVIADNSDDYPGRDGYDIDSVSVAAVPVPAGLALLASGLAALGLMKWRRRKPLASA